MTFPRLATARLHGKGRRAVYEMTTTRTTTTTGHTATTEENNDMRPQKTLAYLVPQVIREHVNARAATLHTNRNIADKRTDVLAEGDYQDAISRLYELQTLVNTLARTENAAIIEAQEDLNAELSVDDRAAIDYEGPQDFDIFEGPLPSGPSSVENAQRNAFVLTWEEKKAKAAAETTPPAEEMRELEAKQQQAIDNAAAFEVEEGIDIDWPPQGPRS